MANVLLVVELILALALVAVVLMQRSEGGGLGIGGGGGGVVSGRSAATALAKLTWVLGIGFFAATIALTVLAARDSAQESVLDRAVAPVTGTGAPAPAEGSDGSLLPVLPSEPAAEAPAPAQ